jgi:hypothetical protein
VPFWDGLDDDFELIPKLNDAATINEMLATKL